MERKRRREKTKKETEKYLVGRLVGGRQSPVKEGGKPRDEERGKAGSRKEGWKERKDLTHRCVISRPSDVLNFWAKNKQNDNENIKIFRD